MKTIGKLWEESNQARGLKVRWPDWGHAHRYFEIDHYDETQNCFIGQLDNGETMAYWINSTNWQLYHDGDEDNAKAI